MKKQITHEEIAAALYKNLMENSERNQYFQIDFLIELYYKSLFK